MKRKGSDENMPNRSANIEPAEGSRENVREHDTGTATSGERRPTGHDNAGGITNRDLETDMDEQQRLPDRGQSKPE